MARNPKLIEILEGLELAVQRKKERAADFFEPYLKQEMFFTLGADKRERLFIAGNQLGKSVAGAYEAKCHLTGEYPKWWKGRRFERPVKGWMAGVSSLLARDVQQKLLCGEPGVTEAFGSGMIPKSAFAGSPSLARGVTSAFDTIQVQHKTNGIVDGVSIGRFKSYEQGREKFQGETLDFVWLDEESDDEIYSEVLTRTVASKGMVYTTFTPLQGKTRLVTRFMEEYSDDRAMITMTIDDVKHFTPEEKARVIAGYPIHERKARAYGVPMLGSGAIFIFPEESISEAHIKTIPSYWSKLWGIDFGIGHPFAAVLVLWDRDNDCVHLHHAIRMLSSDSQLLLPINHAAAMKAIGAAVPVAWPQDGTQRDKGSGDPLAAIYRREGLKMLPEPAMWPEGGNSTEAGIREMEARFATNRLKIASHLSEWFEEYRSYHRKDGQIVKLNDDLLSATRVAIMALRFAKDVSLGSNPVDNRFPTVRIAEGVDFDPHDLGAMGAA